MVTPLQPKPFIGFTMTLAAPDTMYEATIAPYNNTQEVIVYNASASPIYIGIDNVDTPILTPASMTLVPSLASISLYIGSEGDRVPLATEAWWVANYGAGGGGTRYNLFLTFDAAVVDLDVNITYVQGVGGRAGRDR